MPRQISRDEIPETIRNSPTFAAIEEAAALGNTELTFERYGAAIIAKRRDFTIRIYANGRLGGYWADGVDGRDCTHVGWLREVLSLLITRRSPRYSGMRADLYREAGLAGDHLTTVKALRREIRMQAAARRVCAELAASKAEDVLTAAISAAEPAEEAHVGSDGDRMLLTLNGKSYSLTAEQAAGLHAALGDCLAPNLTPELQR